MEDYSQWCSQGPNALAITSVPSIRKDNMFQLELMNGMDNLGSYQEIDMSVTLQTMPITSPVSPSEPDSNSPPGSQSSALKVTDLETQCRLHNRRRQNREAQRRFRQRKEDTKEILDQKIKYLESKCKELLAELQQTSETVAQLQKDKEALQCQIQDPLQLKGIIVHLTQQLKVLQTLSSVATHLTMSITPPSFNASPGSPKTNTSAANEASIMGCLNALLSTLKDNPPSPK
ncbi:hypothetical protein PMG11_10450 [Penicillium brasilianum]|uniref:BZIP domain-containing protein n=1 Tax=Penicillium brasilianum TaxID=104259 RepID=A0A0F7TZ18_PENBI|nr:hypothetical protein PMG11_10450 [Penicillium brasilianum]